MSCALVGFRFSCMAISYHGKSLEVGIILSNEPEFQLCPLVAMTLTQGKGHVIWCQAEGNLDFSCAS